MLKKIDNILVEYEYKKISKKTIIFLHGFLGNLKSFENISQSFQNFGFSTLNINLTDFGFKTLPKSFTIYDYANIVYKLIKKLKIKSCILIGHSFGGRISIILSSMYDLCIEKLVLVDSAGIKPRLNLKTKFKILKYKFCKFLVNKNLKSKEILDKFGSDDYKLLSKNLQSVFVNVVNEDLTYLLKNIKSKTLIIFGKNDKTTPVYMAKKLNKNIKNSTLILLDGGHFCFVDNNFKFLQIVKDFLEDKINSN